MFFNSFNLVVRYQRVGVYDQKGKNQIYGTNTHRHLSEYVSIPHVFSPNIYVNDHNDIILFWHIHNICLYYYLLVFIYFPLFILSSFGFCALLGIIHIFPIFSAPLILPCLHNVLSLLSPIPHSEATSEVFLYPSKYITSQINKNGIMKLLS